MKGYITTGGAVDLIHMLAAAVAGALPHSEIQIRLDDNGNLWIDHGFATRLATTFFWEEEVVTA